MHYIKFILVIFISVLGLALIGVIFWEQELQYTQPTPLPKGYVHANETIVLDIPLIKTSGKPQFLHFYNPDCPCSRFNKPHFSSLVRKHEKMVDFYIVVNLDEHIAAVKEIFGKGVQVIQDKDKEIAKACGVYATPQAVIIDQKGVLYFKGNFNKSRYCTDPETNYAAMALDAVLAKEPAPVFGQLATTAYGCELGKKSWFKTLVGQ